MNMTFSIDAVFFTPEEFAKRTGKTPQAIRDMLKNGQLPIYNTPTSSRAADKGAPKKTRSLLVDNVALQMKALKDAGISLAKGY